MKMLQIRGQLFQICQPIVMGIVNVTPDSFATHCSSMDKAGVLGECERLLHEGADWLDVGACSTRPGGELVSEEEERKRLDCALKAIKQTYPQVIISVDTFRASVAEHVVNRYGVDIINDMSGLSDPEMVTIISRARVPYILAYPNKPGAPMLESMCRQLDRLHEAGVVDVIVDPDFGFGKTLEQNYQCLRELHMLHQLNCPVMVGMSRKSMLYDILDCTPQEALNGTTAAHVLALANGADILRVHDVKEAKETITIWNNYSR